MTTPDPTVVALSLQVADMRQQLADLEMTVLALEQADSKKHKPRESVRWWDISEESRELEVARLRGWERDILLPVLGYHVLPCWPLHLPAVARMETMCELWMTLWLSQRTPNVLASQAEYLIRTLPGLADDIRTICSGCEHFKPQPAKEVAA
jgi:hypothetical protein